MKFARRIDEVRSSMTLEITSKAKLMRSKGIDVANLAAGEPDFDTPSHIKVEAISAIESGFTKYTPSSGIQELKIAVTQKLRNDNNLTYEPSQIVISCGAKHSIYNVLQVLSDQGQEVIIPSPYWVSYPEMVKLSGAKARIIETEAKNNFKLSAKLLLDNLNSKTSIVILNSPSNPTGSVYSKKELEEIAEVIVSHKIFLISDEVYEKITYSPNEHTSIASLGQDIYKQTIVINGVSKSYSMTGWRIGYLAANKEIAEAVTRLQSHSTSNPTSISQRAALAALSGDQGFLKTMLSEFEKRRDYLIGRLRLIKGIELGVPQGSFYLFCDISSLGLSSFDFAKRLLDEEQVAVIPGKAFGKDTHIRISFATSMEEIVKGIDRIEKFVSKLKNK